MSVQASALLGGDGEQFNRRRSAVSSNQKSRAHPQFGGSAGRRSPSARQVDLAWNDGDPPPARPALKDPEPLLQHDEATCGIESGPIPPPLYRRLLARVGRYPFRGCRVAIVTEGPAADMTAIDWWGITDRATARIPPSFSTAGQPCSGVKVSCHVHGLFHYQVKCGKKVSYTVPDDTSLNRE